MDCAHPEIVHRESVDTEIHPVLIGHFLTCTICRAEVVYTQRMVDPFVTND